jgi:hypothetical protein
VLHLDLTLQEQTVPQVLLLLTLFGRLWIPVHPFWKMFFIMAGIIISLE